MGLLGRPHLPALLCGRRAHLERTGRDGDPLARYPGVGDARIHQRDVSSLHITNWTIHLAGVRLPDTPPGQAGQAGVTRVVGVALSPLCAVSRSRGVGAAKAREQQQGQEQSLPVGRIIPSTAAPQKKERRNERRRGDNSSAAPSIKRGGHPRRTGCGTPRRLVVEPPPGPCPSAAGEAAQAP